MIQGGFLTFDECKKKCNQFFKGITEPIYLALSMSFITFREQIRSLFKKTPNLRREFLSDNKIKSLLT